MNIYVGNLSPDVTKEDLEPLFAAFGKVDSVAIIKDRFTGDPRGFAFVEMASAEEGKTAVSSVNGKELKGKNLAVSEARPKGSTGGGSSQGGGRGGFSGHGGGGYGGRGGAGGGESRGSGGKKRGTWGGNRW